MSDNMNMDIKIARSTNGGSYSKEVEYVAEVHYSKDNNIITELLYYYKEVEYVAEDHYSKDKNNITDTSL
jgi:uncharacterized protein YkuJ